ncbi:MAG: CopD family protein [Actinomycetia bacterium]|nr:CopD family protein [Actinomycetes bacterium]
MLHIKPDANISTRSSILLAGLVALTCMYMVLAMIGALSENQIVGLPTVPELTLWGLPLSILIRDVAMALTVGAALMGGVLAPKPDAFLGRVTSLSALVWFFAIAFQSIFTVSEVLAFPLRDSLNVNVWWSLLSQTTVGQVMLVQAVLLIFVVLLGWVVLDRLTGVIVSLIAIAAAFLPGLTGHSGLIDEHNGASISLGLHIVAMTAWVGGLVALVVYLLRAGAEPGKVIRRFSTLALVCVVALAETGLLNASLRLDGPIAMITSIYGAILIAKISILIILISFGWRIRKVISEQADTGALGRAGIALLAGREFLWMGAVLGLSVALSRTAPPAQAQAGDQAAWAALLGLGLFIPFSLVYLLPRNMATIPFVQKYPDVSAICFLIWLYLFITFLPSETIAQTIGGQWFAAIGAAVTIYLGYQMLTAIKANGSWSTVGFALVGLPVVGWWLERDVEGGLHWSFWALTTVAMLFVLYVMRTEKTSTDIESVEVLEVSA